MTEDRFASSGRRGRVRAGAALAALALAVGACSSGSTSPSEVASALASLAAQVPTDAPVASATATPAPSQTVAATSSEEPSATELATAVPSDIDPCQLISQADASSFTGLTLSAGKESTTDTNVRICSYQGPGPTIFSVEIAIAPDEATAKAAEAAEEADLESRGKDLADLNLTVVKLPGFAANTDAAILQGSKSAGALSVAGRAMFVLRGTTFFGFSDVAVNGSVPSQQAFEDEATALLARVP